LTAVSIHIGLTEPAQIKTDKIHIANKDQWSIILEITAYMSYMDTQVTSKTGQDMQGISVQYVPWVF
jgi:hypothetical protein